MDGICAFLPIRLVRAGFTDENAEGVRGGAAVGAGTFKPADSRKRGKRSAIILSCVVPLDIGVDEGRKNELSATLSSARGREESTFRCLKCSSYSQRIRNKPPNKTRVI